MRFENTPRERRTGYRFGIRRELRYKLVKGRAVVAAGTGHTIDMGSGGMAFFAEDQLRPGAAVEMSISWPALLDQTCPMRLIVFGRVLRSTGHKAVCTIERHEFRTAHTGRTDALVSRDSILESSGARAGAAGA